MNIHVLHFQGLGIRAIARKLGISKNTVRRFLRNPSQQPTYSKRPAQQTKLAPFESHINARIAAAAPYWIPAAVHFREIKALGYPGGVSTVRSFVSALKPSQTEPVVRFETQPAEQLQIDFTTIKRGKRTLKAFVATLGYSRASFVRFSHFEKQEDWLTGIQLALEYFGGVPKKLLFDNAKCIMIQRDAYGEGEHKWNAALLNQAKDFGYQPKACRPYRAKTKGKVERFNRYLKESFVTPLAASLHQSGLELTVESANAHVGPWLNTVANVRVHATTGIKPSIRLAEEQLAFTALPVLHAAPVNVIADGIIPQESIQHSLSIYDGLLSQVRS